MQQIAKNASVVARGARGGPVVPGQPIGSRKPEPAKPFIQSDGNKVIKAFPSFKDYMSQDSFAPSHKAY
jgi:hypothetical protein